MLYNPVLQFLRCAIYLLAIPAAQVLVYDHALLLNGSRVPTVMEIPGKKLLESHGKLLKIKSHEILLKAEKKFFLEVISNTSSSNLVNTIGFNTLFH